MVTDLILIPFTDHKLAFVLKMKDCEDVRGRIRGSILHRLEAFILSLLLARQYYKEDNKLYHSGHTRDD